MRTEKIKEIGIVGAGLIGASWSAFYVSKGFEAKLYDVDKTVCRQGYDKAAEDLRFLEHGGLLSEGNFEKALTRLSIAESLAECVDGVDLIQESASERYEIKKELFRQLDSHTNSDTIIASSSSGLSISEIQKVMRHPQRALIAHPFNPPHLIPLVELVGGKQTDAAIVQCVKTFFAGIGKVPIVLQKEVPGYVANRLQAAVWREAIGLIINGVASVGDIDKAVSNGPGLRWALMGPNMIFHLGGGQGGIEHFIDHIGTSFERLWEDMADWTSIPKQAKASLSAGLSEMMAGKTRQEIEQWRDSKLAQLLRVIND